jgi:hypothetical protein
MPEPRSQTWEAAQHPVFSLLKSNPPREPPPGRLYSAKKSNERLAREIFWNSSLEVHRADANVWHGLVGDDNCQSSYLVGDELKEIKFWLGEKIRCDFRRPVREHR